MFQLTILNGKKAGTSWSARLFPVQIGRASACDLSLEEEGIWEKHLEISLQTGAGFVASAPPDVLASINGCLIQQSPLRNGDLIQLGAIKILFGLAPTRQRSLRWREALTWFGLVALCLAQVGLIYWLLG